MIALEKLERSQIQYENDCAFILGAITDRKLSEIKPELWAIVQSSAVRALKHLEKQ